MVAAWRFDSGDDEVDEAALMALGDSDLDEEDDASEDYDFAKVKSSQDGERIGEEIDHVVVLKTGGCCEVKMKITNIVKHNTAPHIWASDDELHVIAYSGLNYVYLAKSITGELLIIWNKTDPLSEYDDDDLSIYHTSNLTVERYEGIYKTSKNFEPITSLDDQAIFVSPNSNSFSIPARSDHHNGCQANSMYFTADALDVLYKRSLIFYRQSGDVSAIPVASTPDLTFKKEAPTAIKEIRKFTMGTKDVRVDMKFNKHIWSRGN
ncbi:60S ribosomal protein L31 [Capsicum baccatum]|uniref:60S ribosomal protein L31 n=1 Tax=Capsicum baccatum TaxID=33114 RepID=A0A2G2VK24_CAPBA|nr:60S ribosomal protein L31 [Capsicum baccatum]